MSYIECCEGGLNKSGDAYLCRFPMVLHPPRLLQIPCRPPRRRHHIRRMCRLRRLPGGSRRHKCRRGCCLQDLPFRRLLCWHACQALVSPLCLTTRRRMNRRRLTASTDCWRTRRGGTSWRRVSPTARRCSATPARGHGPFGRSGPVLGT